MISDLETGENTNPSWDALSKLSQVYDRRPEGLIRHVRLPATTVVSAIMEHHPHGEHDGRGDERRRVMDEDDPFKDISPQQFLAGLEEQPPKFRTEILQIMVKSAPEALIENVRTLRELAVDPNTSDRVRGEAKWVLKDDGLRRRVIEKRKRADDQLPQTRRHLFDHRAGPSTGGCRR